MNKESKDLYQIPAAAQVQARVTVVVVQAAIIVVLAVMIIMIRKVGIAGIRNIKRKRKVNQKRTNRKIRKENIREILNNRKYYCNFYSYCNIIFFIMF